MSGPMSGSGYGGGGGRPPHVPPQGFDGQSFGGRAIGSAATTTIPSKTLMMSCIRDRMFFQLKDELRIIDHRFPEFSRKIANENWGKGAAVYSI